MAHTRGQSKVGSWLFGIQYPASSFKELIYEQQHILASRLPRGGRLYPISHAPSPEGRADLGSGLNALADEVLDADRISYAEIPHFLRPSVEGHAGQLVLGQLAGHDVAILQGRVHAYEGHSQQEVTFPLRVLIELGITTLIVTNAAGGLNPTFRAGDLMLITDHIGLMAMTGSNPLRGPNDASVGPRFPALNNAYDRAAPAHPESGSRAGP